MVRSRAILAALPLARRCRWLRCRWLRWCWRRCRRPSLAQPKQEREQAQPAPTLVLTGNVRGVRSDATTSRQLAIEVLDVQVRIRGSIAETRMTATFRNGSNDVLEGDFAFDMPAGSVITGYALDVGPDLIDGVLAGRDRAREAFQRRVVQRIDPGLAEVTWSDRFSTRIFPIPAQGSRTIRLVMTSPLDPGGGLCSADAASRGSRTVHARYRE